MKSNITKMHGQQHIKIRDLQYCIMQGLSPYIYS